ncbi:MAG TPA: DMT family transporter, partial [Acidobacteriota bacterium]|nr:DMT family transporter [Acidobacteriota bacterium]
RTRRPRGQLIRCLLTLVTWVSFYFAIARMPLGELAAILFSAPLMITALSGPLLGERVGLHRWTALLVGFLGVLLIVRPTGNAAGDWAGIAALVSSLFYALMMIQTRRLTSTESSAAMLVYSAVFMALVSMVTWPFQWQTPGGFDALLLLALGLLGGVSQYAMIQAYRLAPAYVVAPFDYTHLLWAMALGYVIWAEVPDAAMLLGAMVIVCSGLYVLAREARFMRRAARMREAG